MQLQLEHRQVSQEKEWIRPREQIPALIEASCLEWPDGLRDFDHVVSILTVHHFPPATKVGIYAAIRSALGIDGSYVEGDQSGTPEHDTDTMATFSGWIAKLPDGERGAWNYDVTLSVGANQSLLREAGFTISGIIKLARDRSPHTLKVEIEVESIEEAKEAVEGAADVILLDNMPSRIMKEVVDFVDGRCILEASGGVNLDTVADIAETGVNLISVGALTHSAKAMDISLDIYNTR